MSWTVSQFASTLGAIVNALDPIMDWVAPIAMASIFLYFIRSFFD